MQPLRETSFGRRQSPAPGAYDTRPRPMRDPASGSAAVVAEIRARMRTPQKRHPLTAALDWIFPGRAG